MGREPSMKTPTEDEFQVPFQRHSDTSRESAEECQPTAQDKYDQVLARLRDYGYRGATAFELADDLGMLHYSIPGYMIALRREGKALAPVGESGESPRGRRCNLYFAAGFHPGPDKDLPEEKDEKDVSKLLERIEELEAENQELREELDKMKGAQVPLFGGDR
jgi:hypothetical protein